MNISHRRPTLENKNRHKRNARIGVDRTDRNFEESEGIITSVLGGEVGHYGSLHGLVPSIENMLANVLISNSIPWLAKLWAPSRCTQTPTKTLANKINNDKGSTDKTYNMDLPLSACLSLSDSP